MAQIPARVRVLTLNVALGPLDYRLPDGMEAPPGSVVLAPLGPRRVVALVWDEDAAGDDAPIADARLRALIRRIDVPPLPAALRRLIEWTARYYCAPLGAVARMALTGSAIGDDVRAAIEYRPSGMNPDRMTPQRIQAMACIGEQQGSVRDLARRAGVSDAVVRGLVHAGALSAVAVSRDAPYARPDPDHAPPELTGDQIGAAAAIAEAVTDAVFAPFLLDGVTGSGKTETYFEGVASALRQGRQTLVLLPEIALTEPFLKRFAARFGVQPVAWHSGMRAAERRRAWHAIARGEAQVVVGARSALFLPFARPGLIIVDEAHDPSYKQEDGVRYQARDVAVMRARFAGCPVVLASATPAIESRYQVELGHYRELRLRTRHGGAALPEVTAIDLRRTPPDRGRWIAPPLVDALEATLARREQALLFLNRRGYAPLTLCRTCGHRFQCPDCTAWMVEHRRLHRLQCHHCGHSVPPPPACPECGSEDSLVACGPGVERIADEVSARFPDARVALATSDSLFTPAHAEDFIERVEAGTIDIIVGTQMVTKGYHFPELTLVGVIDADLALNGGDLRAAERSYQQIAQVAGRAGRAVKAGRVFIQTHDPDAAVIAALTHGSAEDFYAAETEARRQAGAPPFGRFVAIIVSADDAATAARSAKALAAIAPRRAHLAIYGPAPAPLAMLRGRHRQRLLIHAGRAVDVQAVVRSWLDGVALPRDVRVAVDVDPVVEWTWWNGCGRTVVAASLLIGQSPPSRAHRPGTWSEEARWRGL